MYHSIKKYLLSTHQIPGTLLGAEDRAMNKIEMRLSSKMLYSSGYNINNKEMSNLIYNMLDGDTTSTMKKKTG